MVSGFERHPALGVRVVEILPNKGVLGMSTVYIFLLAFITFCILIIIALSPKSKTCKINTEFKLQGFNFKFETNEKSTPSDQD